MQPKDRILVALDAPDRETALDWALGLDGAVGGFKVGLELFTAAGPALLQSLGRLYGKLFLDLKLHDIPNTVGRATAAAAEHGVDLLTVHALGGDEMIACAAEAAGGRTKILAVTILTSHDEDALRRIGIDGSCSDAALRLGKLALAAGADGLVCSPLEVASLRELSDDALLVVPGIRPGGSAVDDQKRTATPSQAVRSGADHLVIGRPITRADDPAKAAAAIVAELSA